MGLQRIITSASDYLTKQDLDLIRNAHAFAHEKHKGQTRSSGEPYLTHVQEVAQFVTRLGLDAASIATALIHDTVEDTDTSLAEVREKFGAEVAELVDGVTKLNQLNFSSRAEAQAENFRKLLLAMAQDIRVILIKLCDRLHNMQTLEYLSEARRTRIAQETLDIYAPLTNRLGINWMKSELEDLCLKFLKPTAFDAIKKHVAENKRERERYIADVVQLIKRELTQNGISGDVYGRPKHYYSIFQKMERDQLDVTEIFDLIGFRIIVPTQMDCYATLGVLHSAWKPVPGRFKDFIAMPKPNGYRSLHTSIVGPKGIRVEIQIRTPEMHEVADSGIAAHWIYKDTDDGRKSIRKDGLQLHWVRELVESKENIRDPIEFMVNVKEDLFQNEVYVFSPKGDVLALTRGSTPIDFAYAIHSEVGHRCTGAKANGQQVPLSYKLRNGDTIEITTSKNQIPSKDWLNIVATTKAKQRIRAHLKALERERSIAIGRELLTKDLRKIKVSYSTVSADGSLEKAAKDLGQKDIELLLVEIGYGKVTTRQVISTLFPEDLNLEEKLLKKESVLQQIFNRAAAVGKGAGGIRVNGYGDMVYRFARCCEPLPGDELIGFITRGRGVAIHKRGCQQALSFDQKRIVPVSWDDGAKIQRLVRLRVATVDRVGLLAEMTQKISNTGANIVSISVESEIPSKPVVRVDLNIESSDQLATLIKGIEMVKGVVGIERVRSTYN